MEKGKPLKVKYKAIKKDRGTLRSGSDRQNIFQGVEEEG